MISYKFLLRTHVYRNKKTQEFGCHAKIEVELPFSPSVGLHIGAGGRSNQVTHVSWETEENKFYCLVEDIYPESYDTSFEMVKSILKDDGWDLSADLETGLYAAD